MAATRKSIRMQEQVKKLKKEGHSIRKISLMLNLHRRTVRRIILEPDIRPVKATANTKIKLEDWREHCDWTRLIDEVVLRGTTIQALYFEQDPGVCYQTFWRELKKKIKQNGLLEAATIKLIHKPGEVVHVDFCDGLDILDEKTGEIRKTQLFLGVLPFSSHMYGEFVFDQKLPTFIATHSRMFTYFGGVPKYVVPDNLKSAVTRAHRYDPDANQTYVEFANHMGFAVLPARPKKPKDKASVECNIGVIQRSFYPKVRDRTFTSLYELNADLWAHLKELSIKVMKDHGVSRLDRFKGEQEALKPLPSDYFEIGIWKKAKVHPDCHVQIEKNFYSVPYVYIGQTLRVRIGQKLVEIFNEEGLELVATHQKITESFKYSTIEAHYPEKKLALARFEIAHALKQASLIGTSTLSLVQELVRGDQPLRYLRRIQGILRLVQSYSKQAIEFGCSQAIIFKKNRLDFIAGCTKNFELRGGKPQDSMNPPVRELEYIFLHKKAQSTEEN